MLVLEPQMNTFFSWDISHERIIMPNARRTSTPPEAVVLSQRVLEGLLKDIRECMDRYLPIFKRSDIGETASEYVLGLLSGLPRKSAEPISEIFEQERKVFQRFVGESPWNDSQVRQELLLDVTENIGDPDGVLCFDPSSFPKKGKASVGVARQWCGRLGKKENCQTGVFASYASPKGRCLAESQLALPAEWIEDKARRKKARIPVDRVYLTHWELADELYWKVRDLPHACILADPELGRCGKWRDRLASRGEWYALNIPSNLDIRIVDRGVVIPAPHKVSEWVASRPRSDWLRVQTRMGSQGPMVFNVYATEVATLRNDDSLRRETLLAYHPVETPGDIKYALIRMPPGTSLERMIQFVTRRWTIEDCFEVAKTECGMDQYEVRSWVGWHHHMTMSMLALWFLKKLHIARKGAFSPSDGPDDCIGVG